MDPISRSLLMSMGIIKNTLTPEQLAEIERERNCENRERMQAELERERECAIRKREQAVRESLTLDPKTGFELGWDYARFLGWCPDDEYSKHFLGGFATGKKSTWPPPHLDRYTRKWLQLRYGAWRRNRVFDENVTPCFLREIDRVTCPILGTQLTHSTGEASDWSVDRLNNQGGYAVGNLAVMSTHANGAKGNLTLEDIEARAALSEDSTGLTPLQWRRMVSLLTGPYSVIQERELLYPLCIIPPPYVPLNLFQELQLVLVREIRQPRSAMLAKLAKICTSRNGSKHFKKLLVKLTAAREASVPPMEVWLDSEIFACLVAFYQTLDSQSLCKMRFSVERALGSEQVSQDMRQRWALENRGFS